jgi:hypothetical protein
MNPEEVENLSGTWINAAFAAELGESLARQEWEAKLRMTQ